MSKYIGAIGSFQVEVNVSQERVIVTAPDSYFVESDYVGPNWPGREEVAALINKELGFTPELSEWDRAGAEAWCHIKGTDVEVREVAPDALSALDLRREAEACVVKGVEPLAAKWRKAGSAQWGSVLFDPSTKRAGVENGADADWTDASSIEDALLQYLFGEMIP